MYTVSDMNDMCKEERSEGYFSPMVVSAMKWGTEINKAKSMRPIMFINLIMQMLCAIKNVKYGEGGRDGNGRQIGELLPTLIKAKKFNRCQAQIEIRMPK